MKRSILSIGRNRGMSYLLKTIIENSYDLTTVNDVFSGTYLLKKGNEIDIIIIDLDYQTKEGIDFILHIRTSKIYNQHLIILSNEENHESIEPLLNGSGYNYFVKPFNPINLSNRVNDLMISKALSKVLKQ